MHQVDIIIGSTYDLPKKTLDVYFEKILGGLENKYIDIIGHIGGF